MYPLAQIFQKLAGSACFQALVPGTRFHVHQDPNKKETFTMLEEKKMYVASWDFQDSEATFTPLPKEARSEEKEVKDLLKREKKRNTEGTIVLKGVRDLTRRKLAPISQALLRELQFVPLDNTGGAGRRKIRGGGESADKLAKMSRSSDFCEHLISSCLNSENDLLI